MDDKQFERNQRELERQITELGVRIRRYTLDDRLKEPAALQKLEELHASWLILRSDYYTMMDHADRPEFNRLETEFLRIDRQVDLIQRDLVSVYSFNVGCRTSALLAGTLIVLLWIYLFSHGIHGWNVEDFEPWAEWGPVKYIEVAVWSEFGVLCYLLFQASKYVMRRDFDAWYQPWYLSTALRAPFLTVILMILVLEFVEWYGEDGWLKTYMEEGNKFYLIAFMSFCLGLVSDRASGLVGELAQSVLDFIGIVVKKISSKLRTAISPEKEIAK